MYPEMHNEWYDNHQVLVIKNDNGEDQTPTILECYVQKDLLNIDIEHPDIHEYGFAYLNIEEAKKLYVWLGSLLEKWQDETKKS